MLPLMSDQYKINGHFRMLEPFGTQVVYSYMEARTGAEYDAVCFCLLQYYIKRYLMQKITKEDVDYAEKVAAATNFHSRPFNREMWDRIVDVHGGRLPIHIKAVKEGTTVPTGHALMTIENTDLECAPLTNLLETLLMKLWYPVTIAYRSRETMRYMMRMFDQTSELPREVAQHLYIDFGYRGVTSEEQAAIGGAAHLLSNFGSDTMAGSLLLMDYYNQGDFTIDGIVGSISYGVPASEHSIGTAGGEAGEFGYYQHMIEEFPDGLVSIVADSFNVVRFVTDYTRRLKDDILARWENGKADLNRVILRPDSPRFEGDTAWDQVLWFHEELGKIFGYTKNAKGYKVLHPCIGILYGDGISDEDIRRIYRNLADNGWSIENCAVGQGGGLLNAGDKNTRDTNRFAIKCSAQKQNGEWVDIKKNPLDTSKASKAGRMQLLRNDKGEFHTLCGDDPVPEGFEGCEDLLETVFLNGELVRDQSLAEIRELMVND